MTERHEDPRERALARRISLARTATRLVMLVEQALPHLIAPLSVLSLFLSVAWFGLFRTLPDIVRILVGIVLTFSFLTSMLPLLRLSRPGRVQVDQRLESTTELPHQAISLQSDRLVADTPFARALWEQHRASMARKIGDLQSG